MIYDEWRINYLNLNCYLPQEIKKKIKILYKNFGNNNYNFNIIQNKLVNKALDNIANYQDIIICFDIEFQTYILKNFNGIFFYEEQKKIFQFIREFGLILFIRSKNKEWAYMGEILINCQDLTNLFDKSNKKFNSSKYMSVNKNTQKLLLNNESIFFNYLKLKNNQDLSNYILNDDIYNQFAPESLKIYVSTYLLTSKSTDKINKNITKKLEKLIHLIYGKQLNKKQMEVFINQNTLYYLDTDVKSRLTNDRTEKLFLNIFYDLTKLSMLVVKGQKDFAAFKNTCILNEIECLHFDSIYDIEIFNLYSQIYCGNAQLETTNNCFLSIYPEINNILNDILGKNKIAHNPVSDSMFTLHVAIKINIILGNFFSHNNKKLFSNSIKNM